MSNKKRKKLKKTINTTVVDVLEKMKTLNKEDRYHLFMERGEWIFNYQDEIEEDILMCPNFEEG